MLEIVEALQALGVDAVASSLDDAPDDADIVHLYALGHLERQAPKARARWPDRPFALTPIFVPWSLGNVVAARDRRVLIAASKNVVKNRLWWWRCRGIVRDAAAVFPCSTSEARSLRRFYRLPAHPHWRVATTGLHTRDWPEPDRSGSRAQRAARLGLPADATVLVACAGRLEPLKNQRGLIRAVASIDGAALVLFGAKRKQPYADDVVAAGEATLGDRFRWADQVSRDDVRAALAAADVFALCSVREVASIATLEGAASGCEVVATRSGANEEYYADLAHLCSPSAEGIAAAIEAATNDLRQPMLRARVIEQFDWSAPATVIAETYGQLLSAARS